MPDQQETRLGQQVGTYRLVRELGSGRYGTVYLAEHLAEHTQVAVKVLDGQLTRSEDVTDFMHAASTMRLLHPHIVPLLDSGITHDDAPFLVMEYVPGGTLRDRHPRGERVPLSTVVSYVDQIASALQYVHDHHLLHEDIKPENILVRADGTLMVSDAGVAHLLEQRGIAGQQTEAGMAVYTAPEQAEGHPGFASDQYALAVLAYEWISGTIPVHEAEGMQPVQDTAIPQPVERVILQALARDPQDRFERIQEFAAALHEGVQAPADTRAPLPSSETSNPASPPPREPASHPLSHPTPEVVARPGGKSSWLVGGTIGIVLLLIVAAITLLPALLAPAPVTRQPPPIATATAQQSTPSTTATAQQSTPTATATAQQSTPTATPTQPDQITQQWVFATRGAVQSSPLVVNGVLYVSSADHKVYALNASTGKQKWVFATRGAVQSSPLLVNGVLYIGSADHKVYALNASTGKQKWVFSTGGAVQSSPTVVDGVLYIGSDDHKVYALDATTGKQKWTFLASGPVQSTPAANSGVLYVDSLDGKIYALDGSTGQQTWTFALGSAVHASPTIADGVLYIGSFDGSIYALDASTGKQKWVFPTTSAVWSTAVVAGGVLYVGSDDDKVYALDASTGEQKWTFSTGDSVRSSPVVVNTVLYVGSFDHNIYALDASTGQMKWVFPTGAAVSSTPMVVDGVLYIGSDDSSVYALTLPA
jgi:eukaryotic-like serine/threonine-protein kinase